MSRDEQDFALPDRDVARLSVLDRLEDHVAAQLVEELLVRVVVVIGARVGQRRKLNAESGTGFSTVGILE
jgi:hypothetical protein